MSVSAGANLVEWPQLVAAKEQGRASAVFSCAVDEGQSWVQYYQPKHRDLFVHWTAAIEASDAYQSAREMIDPNLRRQLDAFVSVTFAGASGSPLNDLLADFSREEEAELFAITASPSSARRLADLWLEIRPRLIPLAGPFREHFDARTSGRWICSFSDFVSYMEMWGELFLAAKSKNKGVVITIA